MQPVSLPARIIRQLLGGKGKHVLSQNPASQSAKRRLPLDCRVARIRRNCGRCGSRPSRFLKREAFLGTETISSIVWNPPAQWMGILNRGGAEGTGASHMRPPLSAFPLSDTIKLEGDGALGGHAYCSNLAAWPLGSHRRPWSPRWPILQTVGKEKKKKLKKN